VTDSMPRSSSEAHRGKLSSKSAVVTELPRLLAGVVLSGRVESGLGSAVGLHPEVGHHLARALAELDNPDPLIRPNQLSLGSF
jgi:hypothetical protein